MVLRSPYVRDHSGGTRSDVRRVLDQDGTAGLDGARVHGNPVRRHRRDGGERLPHRGIPPAVRELRHEGQHSVALPSLNRAAIDAADLGDLDRDALEEALRLQRRVEDLGDVEQGPCLFEAPARLRVEGGVVNGDGGLAAQRLEQAQILVVEGAAGPDGDGQGAQHLIAQDQRHAGERDDALGVDPLGVVRARILAQVGHEERSPRGDDMAHEPLAHLRANPPGDAGDRPRAGAEGEPAAVVIDEPEPRHARAEEVDRRPRHPVEHLLEAQGGGERLGQPREGGEAAAAIRGGLVQARVLERDGGLPGEGDHEIDLPLVRRPRLPPVHREHAIRLALDDDGHGEHRAVALPLDEGALAVAELDVTVGEDIGRPDRAPLEIAPARRPLARIHAQVLDESGG